MTIRKVISKNALSLQPSRPVTDFNDIYVQQTIRDLYDSLANMQAEIDMTRPEASGGVGLAANQIEYPESFYPADFVPYNIYVVNVRPLRAQLEQCPEVTPSVYINATFKPMVSLSGNATETAEYMEGCLSIAGINSPVVKRYRDIFVEFFDENAAKQTLPAQGFIARIHQHEIDHGAGEEFLNQLSFSDQELNTISAWLASTDKSTVKKGDWILEEKLFVYFLPADFDALSAWVRHELNKKMPSLMRVCTDQTLFGARSPASGMHIASPTTPSSENESMGIEKLKIR